MEQTGCKAVCTQMDDPQGCTVVCYQIQADRSLADCRDTGNGIGYLIVRSGVFLFIPGCPKNVSPSLNFELLLLQK